jgi:hypothetical protein
MNHVTTARTRMVAAAVLIVCAGGNAAAISTASSSHKDINSLARVGRAATELRARHEDATEARQGGTW